MHTVFADTGGVDDEERAYIEKRAAELGVASHVTVDGGPAIWDGFVKPFVWAGEGYQGQYPLLVSDRYLIVDAALARCRRPRHRMPSRTAAPAWATTRCASTWRCKAARRLRIVAPIREIQKEHTEDARLRTGVSRGARLRRAREAEGLHDQREPAGRDHVRRRDRSLASAGRGRARLVRAARGVAGRAAARDAAFVQGEAVALDGERTRRRADPRRSSTRCSRNTASAAGSTRATPRSA